MKALKMKKKINDTNDTYSNSKDDNKNSTRNL